MATPLASKFFENSGTGTDGWDDWDWVENNNSSNAKQQQLQQQQQQQQQNLYHQSAPPLTTVPHLPNNVQQMSMDSNQTANLFNANRKSSIPSQVGHPSIDQYVQSPARFINNNNNQLPMNPISNNVINHFQTENQHQHPSLQQQSYGGIESASFVNNNNSNNIQNVDTMNSNNIVQSSGLTNYHLDHNQSPQQNQNQWPVSYGGMDGSSVPLNIQAQQFMQVESQEQQFPPPIPARTQYTNYEQQTTSVEQNVMHDNGHYENLKLENQQPAAPTEAPIPTFSNANNSFPPVLPPPAMNQTPFANTNPFKRVGSHAHRATSIMPTVPSPSMPAPMMENQPQPIIMSQENVDSIQHNDRNEYLQTGHLSGDGESSNTNQNTGNIPEVLQYNSNDANGLDTELPPPGLSRLVLGEPEPVASNQVNNQPTPAFDRLIPGTEINHTSNINLERQADGQDDIEPVSNRLNNNNQFSSVPSQQVNMPLPPLTTHEIENYEAISESDRNQYLVAGENPIDNAVPVSATVSAPMVLSTTSSIDQRVVTGLENVENQEISTLPESQRELEMDGENLEDQQQQQQQQQQQNQQIQAQHREGNAPTGTTIALSQSESIEELDVPNSKNPSNPSTGNDDSDREKTYYNRTKGSSSRNRNEDRPRRRDDKHENRYETEDTDQSTREKARGKDKYEEKDRKYRGRSADLDENDSRSYRDGRSERSYREKYRRDDGERYDRRRHGESRSHRDDKYSRYETDGSRYDNEESRYERRRIGEKDDYGRYREGRADRGDRYYRSKDYERERDRVRGRDDRYSDYDNGYSNTLRRERKKDRSGNGSERGDAYSSGYFQQPNQQFGYDPYSSYYQNQQYYENLRLTNPVAYAEWYNRFFANQLSSAASAVAKVADGRGRESGRESVHSGRSSTKDNERYILSATQGYYHSYNANQLLHSQTQPFSLHHNSTMLDKVSSTFSHHQNHQLQQSYFASSAMSVSRSTSPFPRKLSQQQQQNTTDFPDTPAEPERLTPFKFTSNHCSASFQNGLLICAKQKYLPNNEIQNNVNVLKFAQNNSIRRLYQMFPGPLSPATHTKQVIDFCLEQIRNGPMGNGFNSRSTNNSMCSLQSVENTNRASFTLLWNFLILLLRQRGAFVGSDIAELLLKNKEEFPYEQHQLNSTKLSASPKDSNELSDPESKDESNDPITSESEPISLSEDEITDKFRNYLLYGSITEALDWASDNNLWGHALFLASKMDRRTHANVMIKFANKLSLADPLQTLYQFKSGRVPISVTCTQDEKWGDWRPHLAMIISNPSQTSELDKKTIITMGDTLHNRGDLFAAQFCYLMARVEFSKYSDVKHDASMILNNTSNAVRIILLGSSAYKATFAEFATDEAIIMTEIYEYACTLANSQFSIVEFQPYKYLLGTRMLDYGFHLKSLLYMEQVALHIQKNSSHYDRSFVERVYSMGDKLKYFDPVLEKSLDNLNDEEGILESDTTPQWQTDLLGLLGAFPVAPVYTENTVPMMPVDSYQQQQQQQPMSLPTMPTSQIDQEFTQINQQLNSLNLQYTNSSYEYSTTQSNEVPMMPAQQEIQSPNNYTEIDYQQNQNYENHQHSEYYAQPPQNDSSSSSNTYADQSTVPQMVPGYQQPSYADPMAYATSNFAESTKSTKNSDLSKSSNLNSHFDIAPKTQSNYMNQPPMHLINQAAQPESIEEDDEDDDDDDDSEQDGNDVPAQPKISMPNSFSNRPGFYDDAEPPTKTNQNSTETKTKPIPAEKKAASTDNSKKSGWIGGILSKISLKPKNQMILPDDKDPAIVWDEKTKRWLNKDNDEDETEAFKPPPKMSDMMGPAAMPAMPAIPAMPTMPVNNDSKPVPSIPMAGLNQTDPNNPMNTYANPPTVNASQGELTNNGPTAVPSLQSNMFKMQRNKTLKNSYVDVFNPSGAAPKNNTPILAPTMPTMPAQQMNFFVPSPNLQQNQDEPSFYNPNQYGGYQQ